MSDPVFIARQDTLEETLNAVKETKTAITDMPSEETLQAVEEVKTAIGNTLNEETGETETVMGLLRKRSAGTEFSFDKILRMPIDSPIVSIATDETYLYIGAGMNLLIYRKDTLVHVATLTGEYTLSTVFSQNESYLCIGMKGSTSGGVVVIDKATLSILRSVGGYIYAATAKEGKLYYTYRTGSSSYKYNCARISLETGTAEASIQQSGINNFKKIEVVGNELIFDLSNKEDKNFTSDSFTLTNIDNGHWTSGMTATSVAATAFCYQDGKYYALFEAEPNTILLYDENLQLQQAKRCEFQGEGGALSSFSSVEAIGDFLICKGTLNRAYVFDKATLDYVGYFITWGTNCACDGEYAYCFGTNMVYRLPLIAEKGV